MSFVDLREFVRFLEARGCFVHVQGEVSSVFEITEIHRRLVATQGPAVLFKNVVTEHGPCSIPVLVNLFGTLERVALGLGVEPCGLRGIGELLAFLRSPTPPESFRDLLSMVPMLRNVVAARTRVVKKAPCHEVIMVDDDVDLRKLPIQTCWPGEPAPLITWPIVVTRGPSSSREDNFNLGVYRMQVVSKNSTIMRWLRHRGGAQQYRRWVKEGKGDFPAAVVIGSDPATLISAVAPVPDTISEYQFAGVVSADELLEEGPYGDHTGYYNSVERFPKFTVKAITMRSSPMYMSTFTGRPPDECSVLGEVLTELLIPMLKLQYPEVTDFWLPPEGCSYRVAVVSMKKAYPGHARRIVMGILSYLRQFLYVKFVIVVDEDICARDWKDVIWAMSTRMDPARDTMVIERSPIDYLDFASPEEGLGSKVGFDATNKIYPETTRSWGVPLKMSEDIAEKVTSRWAEYGFTD
ncbi:hypothetical protein GH714_042995 [Hevea brasiliensis]|uniref:UbiD family decarboxylase n=1 Tax=Hevea brasiliensis TaxID=3981 RepID=A0A6A6K021_HEVBR|nr:hypothetical protein GH714_042995 [Hevea brasiliensis]